MHEFYEKPTNSNLVILANSALSFKVKRTVFTQECLRRLRNTSLSLGPDVANKFLSKYMLKLKDSGYSQKFRAEIIRSAKNAFNLQSQNDRKGIRPLFRDKKRILQDQKEKGVGVIDWWNKAYYDDSNKQRFSTILFVPPTPGAKLAKQMQKREAELNAHSDTRIKVVETGGHRLKLILVQNNLYPTLPCIKQLCPFCKETVVSVPAENSAQLNSAKLSCRTPSVGYTVSCMECKKNGTPAIYIGETGRTAVTRGEEHIRAILKKNPQNPMSKHLSKAHANQKHVKFEFGITQPPCLDKLMNH